MLNRDYEQRFPLTALIIILVLIVLASLVLMSFRSTALPPSPSEIKEQHVFVNNMNFEPFYFFDIFVNISVNIFVYIHIYASLIKQFKIY